MDTPAPATVSAFPLTFCGANVWAGPIEEVSELARPRQQAFAEGNVDAFVAAFADNAVVYTSFLAFRLEGKEAIRQHANSVFQLYPRRWFAVRQPLARSFGDDLVLQDAYKSIYVVSESGDSRIYDARATTIWKKLNRRWRIVSQHISQLPANE